MVRDSGISLENMTQSKRTDRKSEQSDRFGEVAKWAGVDIRKFERAFRKLVAAKKAIEH
jgi:hypothetical protein